MQEFWRLSADERQRLAALAADAASRTALAVAVDAIDADADSSDVPEGMGIVVRADYADEDAWRAFCMALKDAEAELYAPDAAQEGPDAEASGAPGDEGDEDDSDSDEEMDAAEPESATASTPSLALFTLVSPPPGSAARARLAGLSNIAALRLYTDADVTVAPARPRGAASAPASRLIALDGCVEVYRGPPVWVYDAQSNANRSVRLVSPRGAGYGDAT